MLCECGKHEATIHEVIITSDKRKVERHLCEFCAREQGVSADPYIPIDQLISTTSYIMGQALTGQPAPESPGGGQYSSIKARPQPRQPGSPTSCVGCGLSYAQFKKYGLLGCPACYQTFADRLGPMIERAHEGGCSHVGKVPKRALQSCRSTGDPSRLESLLGDVRQREERLELLRQRLAKSIRDEEYEKAAMLRDELTRLTTLADTQIEPTPTPGQPGAQAAEQVRHEVLGAAGPQAQANGPKIESVKEPTKEPTKKDSGRDQGHLGGNRGEEPPIGTS